MSDLSLTKRGIFFVVFALPLFGVFSYCLKVLGVGLLDRKTKDFEPDRVMRVAGTILLIITLMLTAGLLVFCLLIFLFSGAIDRIPVIFRVLPFVGIVVFYYCVAGFVHGLGQAVGVSGISASKIFKQLYDAFAKKQGKP
jgi:hypothetical protein